MRSALTVYPVRRVSVPTKTRRRTTAGRRDASDHAMLAKLSAASSRLARARPRR